MMKTIFKAAIITILLGHSINESSAMIDLNKYSKKLYTPVAIVDDVLITEKEVQQKINIMRMSGIDITRDAALENTINETVVLSSAKDKAISQDFIEGTISNLAAENGLSNDDFKQMLKKFGVEVKYLKKQIEAQIILNEMINNRLKELPNTKLIKTLYKNSKIVKEQIKQNDNVFMKSSIEWKFNNDSQVKISEILISQNNQKNFEKIVELLRANTDFGIIKNKFPKDVEITGLDGAIGWVDYKDMSDEYKQVIKNSSIGYLTEPLVMGNKFLFIKILDIKNAIQSQKPTNQKYLKLSYDQKSEMIFNNIQSILCADNLLNQLKKQVFIQLL